tara:strand:- start:323 stop:700 length:378 start_codon:yes stop_codon:yes gene_type:complete
MADYDKYPRSKEGGLWKNDTATTENRKPPYHGHIVLNEEMLQTLVVLYRNKAFKCDGENPEEGPRVGLSAWLNTSVKGDKYFRVESSVYYPSQHDHLFEGNTEAVAAPEPAPAPAQEAEDDDFPF